MRVARELVFRVPRSNEALYLRVARGLVEEITRGRLAPGAALPGTRALAATLGVHRNTVLAAYRELAAQGWLEAREGSGTTVSAALPTRDEAAPPSSPATPGGVLGFALRPERARAEHDRDEPARPRGVLALDGGVPDLRLLPAALLGRALRRAAVSAPAGRFGYGPAEGDRAARRALARWLAQTRGVAVTERTLALTAGSQMALYLLARVLVAPGDRVAVEVPGYAPAWSAFERAGARLVSVPVDAEGLDVRALERAHARAPLRAVYVTPQHQYPTMATLSASRRLALLSFAARARVAVVEDDYDHEFHYEGRPVLPLASRDDAGVVLYVATLSKALAPALRIGCVAGPAPVLERLARERFVLDRQGDRVTAAAVAALLDEGALERHVRAMRRVYRARRDALCEALARCLGARARFSVPAGGMALWLEASDPRVCPARWSDECLARGVAVQPATRFVRGRTPAPRCLRVGFACASEDELRRAARVLAAAYDASLSGA